ncbi:hypothetical protein TNCV_593251 [Trichonephila clavipes]|nr:hypothetical protein TNCV_593251 [Trichonephila clavipes]
MNAIGFEACPRWDLSVRSLATWLAKKVRHVIEDIVWRVETYVDERCLASKLHIGKGDAGQDRLHGRLYTPIGWPPPLRLNQDTDKDHIPPVRLSCPRSEKI